MLITVKYFIQTDRKKPELTETLECDKYLAAAFDTFVGTFYGVPSRDNVGTNNALLNGRVKAVMIKIFESPMAILPKVLNVKQGTPLDKGSSEAIFRQFIASRTNNMLLLECTWSDTEEPTNTARVLQTQCAISGRRILDPAAADVVWYSTANGVIYPFDDMYTTARGRATRKHYAYLSCFQERFQATIQEALENTVFVRDEKKKIEFITKVAIDEIIGTSRQPVQTPPAWFGTRNLPYRYADLEATIRREVRELVRGAGMDHWAELLAIIDTNYVRHVL